MQAVFSRARAGTVHALRRSRMSAAGAVAAPAALQTVTFSKYHGLGNDFILASWITKCWLTLQRWRLIDTQQLPLTPFARASFANCLRTG
jgi:hypothetical protein